MEKKSSLTPIVDVSTTDLLDAFEIYEHALAEIIGGHSTRVAALAKKLIKKHGSK